MSKLTRPRLRGHDVNFADRRAAGQVLARRLTRYRGDPAVRVLGLARGGVPVGWEIAAALAAPLDVFLVRKLSVPDWPELAIGALSTGGVRILNSALMERLGVGDADLAVAVARESAELRRREAVYRGDRPPLQLQGSTVILADDGIATGASMRAAVRAVRAQQPAAVVVAVPVGPAAACHRLAMEADAVVCVVTPANFDAVGQAYGDFSQVGDTEVCTLLATPTAG